MRWRRSLGYALVVIAAAFLAVKGFKLFNDSVTRGLEEEKSYSRNAMEYHRLHPDTRKGDLVLEVWSDADYIAHSVEQEEQSQEWAQWSDKLPYVSEKIRRRNGRPYCVISTSLETLVVWFPPQKSGNCDTTLASDSRLADVRSGELEFSGRTDYWVFVLRKNKT